MTVFYTPDKDGDSYWEMKIPRLNKIFIDGDDFVIALLDASRYREYTNDIPELRRDTIYNKGFFSVELLDGENNLEEEEFGFNISSDDSQTGYVIASKTKNTIIYLDNIGANTLQIRMIVWPLD